MCDSLISESVSARTLVYCPLSSKTPELPIWKERVQENAWESSLHSCPLKVSTRDVRADPLSMGSNSLSALYFSVHWLLSFFLCVSQKPLACCMCVLCVCFDGQANGKLIPPSLQLVSWPSSHDGLSFGTRCLSFLVKNTRMWRACNSHLHSSSSSSFSSLPTVAPSIWLPSKAISHPLHQEDEITLSCHIESCPSSVNYWIKEEEGTPLVTRGRQQQQQKRRLKRPGLRSADSGSGQQDDNNNSNEEEVDEEEDGDVQEDGVMMGPVVPRRIVIEASGGQNGKFRITEETKDYKTHLMLTIRRLESRDLGRYTCLVSVLMCLMCDDYTDCLFFVPILTPLLSQQAKNSLGEQEASLLLKGMLPSQLFAEQVSP